MSTPTTTETRVSDLLNATETAALLGISRRLFHDWKRRGLARRFLVTQPMGQRRYSRRLIQLYVDGQPIARVGRGARSR